MGLTEIIENKAVDYVFIVGTIGVVAYLAYDYIKNNMPSLPQMAYDLATSNPISQLGSDTAIKSYFGSDYSNAEVVYSDTATSSQTMPTSNVPIIYVSPTSVGSYNPAYGSTATSTTLGSFSNPYNYSDGWQGAGVYSELLPNGNHQIQTYTTWWGYITRTPQ